MTMSILQAVILCLLLVDFVDGASAARLIGSFQSTAPLRATKRLLCTPRSVNSIQKERDPSIESKSSHKCRFCNAPFTSRNALFRHVRSDPTCSRLAADGKPYSHLNVPKRQKIALEFQYYSIQTEEACTTSTRSEAEVAGKTLCSAIQEAIDSFVCNDLALNDCDKVEILSKTQSSVSNLRHFALSQEKKCGGAADVLVLSVLAPAAVTCTIVPEKDDPDQQKYFLNTLLKSVNSVLKEIAEPTGLNVTLLACKLLSSTSRLHAERSCTQRVYHYLMPLQWLPGGSELEQWWIQSEKEPLLVDDHANHHTSRAKTRPPNDSLRLLKNALRSAECATVTTIAEGRNAAGRFGALATKLRRPWHNFASPALRGDASPNNEPVWCVLDRARLVQLETRHHDRVFAVLEFRGDDFLPEQVRRIVGTAVAMTHGWLSSSAFDLLTRPDVLIEAPLAPEGHLYLAALRFHFEELRTSGLGIFDTETDGPVVKLAHDVYGSIQQRLLMNLSDESVQRREALWLENLRDVVAPRMLEEFKLFSRVNLPLHLKTVETLKPPPDCYTSTLSLLRDVIATDKWPATSAARTAVIREANAKKGSFTVVNPAFQMGYSKNDPPPLGNKLFPALVDAVFDLEKCLTEAEIECTTAEGASLPRSSLKMQKRPPSSHCAINCNAEFTPHVDSGRGAGQSLSMIVGLGDYVGGELAVEGKGHDVRYRPLEFDGWKLRHWTLPFCGERFSLVWFTPEEKRATSE